MNLTDQGREGAGLVPDDRVHTDPGPSVDERRQDPLKADLARADTARREGRLHEADSIALDLLARAPGLAPAVALRAYVAVALGETDLASFDDTAALLENLDLLITVDSAVAHLAGALGRPVWVLLPTPSDWRWLRDRDDSPWYPSLRLLRQPTPGDWHAPIARAAALLAER